jgi:putative ABC transport system permease protein
MRRIRRLFRRSRAEKELDQELRFHLERQMADNLAAGMSPEDARRNAMLEFGGLEGVKEEVRDTRWETCFDNLFRDFAFAFRGIRKDRRFSLVAILALALGIGASTIVFSVVDSVFFRALPYKDFNQSVVFEKRVLQDHGAFNGLAVKERGYYFTAEELRAVREQNHVFADFVSYGGMRPTYDDGKSVRYFNFGSVVSTNAFEYLGVAPLMGRTFSEEDGKPGAPPVFVMNYRLWQGEFGGDPKILGKVFVLNGTPTTLVGIMPAQFNAFDSHYSNFWLPISLDGAPYGQIIGRLKAGVSMQAAGADIDSIVHGVPKTHPWQVSNEKFTIVAEPLLDSLIGNFKKTIYGLLAAVLLLLLIACSNVANLLLARATAREREMAMRAMLGATRGRLIRQLLVESFVLAAAGSLAGCMLAYAGVKAVAVLIPPGTLPEETVIRMNAPVFLLALGASILTTVLCGLAPALHVATSDLQPRLSGSGGGTDGTYRHGKLRGGLVVSEVALSVVLLIGAGLLMRSFLVLTRVDLGFNPKNVLYFVLNLPPTYNTNLRGSLEKKNALTQQLLERLQAQPGVTSVAEFAEPPPLKYGYSNAIIPGKPHTERWETRYEMCSRGFFQTLGVPLVRGRFFSEDDEAAERDVMVVNESFSREFFPNEDPLGDKVKLEEFDLPYLAIAHDLYFEIVGVVRDYKTRGYDDPAWQNFPMAFVPYSVANFNWRAFMARTAGDPGPLLKNAGALVQTIDPGVQIDESGTLEGGLREFYRGPQFQLATLASFAGIGLLLVIVGIFSVMAYTVSLQTHEIGIRMALGAQQTTILGQVLLNGFRLVGAGILIGVAASFALTRFLASEISGVSTTDPWTFTAVVAVVVLVGLGACLLPARRAAQVDPMVALRYE